MINVSMNKLYLALGKCCIKLYMPKGTLKPHKSKGESEEGVTDIHPLNYVNKTPIRQIIFLPNFGYIPIEFSPKDLQKFRRKFEKGKFQKGAQCKSCRYFRKSYLFLGRSFLICLFISSNLGC